MCNFFCCVWDAAAAAAAAAFCCRLFLTQDNEFAGDNQSLTVEETVEYTSGMSIL